MMLLFYVTYQIRKEKNRESFFRDMQEKGIVALTRKEKGNLLYDFSFSAEHKHQINLVEAWSSEEEVAAHKKTDQFFQLQEIKAQYVEDMQLRRYEVTSE